jgi:2-polyprenyl-3-methyl-5-hydroxy-6-metoxy-1,4-benzoquinol methylase
MIVITGQRVIRQHFVKEAAQGRTVLDIGCIGEDGLQRLHREVKAVARACTGMDIVPGADVVGDAQRFEFTDGFEVIIAGEVIEHLGDVRGFIESCMNSVVVGGRLIVTTPNPYSFNSIRRALFGRQVPNNPTHVLLFDATVLANMFRIFGKGRFQGQLYFYEEAPATAAAYRLNKAMSAMVRGWSSGLLLDLRRIA